MTRKRKQSRDRWSRIEKIMVGTAIMEAILKILDWFFR